MPKGDRLKLKADPEDGTTPISNLLLEAVAMAKISGLQKGAVLYLWRRTYGWVENGQRLKERKITLTEWKKALDSSPSRCSKALSDLEAHNIIKRRVADIWGGYYYQINTIVSSWNQYCINLAKLAEYIGIDDFATVDQSATVDHNDNSLPKQNSDEIGNSYPKKDATVDQNATQQLTKTQPPTLYKENINKDKESNAGDIYKLFDENFQRITQRTRDILNDLINEYGIDKVHSALDKAIRQNKRFINYVEGILKNSDNKKQEHKPKHQTDIKIRK